jgi:hypothetical protein
MVVEAAGIAQPYGIENKQVIDFKFRSACQNRYSRYLNLPKTYVMIFEHPKRPSPQFNDRPFTASSQA